MRPKSVFHRWVLSLAAALCVASHTGRADLTSPAAPADPLLTEQPSPEGKEAVAYALERVRRTGSFNHPGYPWVVRARRVEGDTLYFVEFLRRRKDGKGFSAVGKAAWITLTYSPVYHPSELFGESKPPERRDTLVAHVGHMSMHTEDLDYTCIDRIFELPLPSRLRASAFSPYGEARICLSKKQRKVLAEDYPLEPGQKRLLAAFGDEGAELLRGDVSMSGSGRTVIAWHEKGKNGVRLRGGRYHFPRIAVARFDKEGAVELRFRGKDVSVDKDSFFNLTNGEESQSITLRQTNGKEFVLPRIEAAP